MKRQRIELICNRFRDNTISFEELRMSIISILSECNTIEEFFDCLRYSESFLKV